MEPKERHWWVVGPGKYQQFRTRHGVSEGDVWQVGAGTWYGYLPGEALSSAVQFSSEEAAKTWVEVTITLAAE